LNTPHERQWVIAADIRLIDQVCEEITDFLDSEDLCDQLFEVMMLARESLNNAVIHGCSKNRNRRVCCKIGLGQDRLCLQVEDDGPGFDWQTIVNDEMVEVSSIHGRGLWIYRLFSDQIDFSPSGNRVTFTRELKKGAVAE
jgi:serine/threonine-protein kinase RsbW